MFAAASSPRKIVFERETVFVTNARARAVYLVAGGNAMEQFDQKAVSSPADRRAQVKASTFVQESKSRQRNAWGGGSTVRGQTGITMYWHACASFSVKIGSFLSCIPRNPPFSFRRGLGL